MSDSAAPPSSHGFWIRFALMTLPFGTIVLGMASFVIWKWREDQVDNRNYQYALAMRQDPNEAAWQRHVDVLERVATQPTADRLNSSASYLQSSFGPENMGYTVERQRLEIEGVEFSNVQIELTGDRRPRELVQLVLVYGSEAEAARKAEHRALASVLTLAHWVTGEPVGRTLRVTALPLEAAGKAAPELLQQMEFSQRKRSERTLRLHLLAVDQERWLSTLQDELDLEPQGTVLNVLPIPAQADEAIEWIDTVRELLFPQLRVEG